MDLLLAAIGFGNYAINWKGNSIWVKDGAEIVQATHEREPKAEQRAQGILRMTRNAQLQPAVKAEPSATVTSKTTLPGPSLRDARAASGRL